MSIGVELLWEHGNSARKNQDPRSDFAYGLLDSQSTPLTNPSLILPFLV